MASKEHEELVELMKQQINATHRATHAVRAIVLPSTITLIALLIALPIMLLGVFSGEGGGIAALFIGGLVLIVGGIMAISAQITETRLSDVPGIYAEPEVVPGPVSEPSQPVKPAPSTGAGESANSKTCSFCGASFRRTRLDCPECGMS